MTITSNQISKTIGQILVLASLVAYWAPAVSYMSTKILPASVQTIEAMVETSKNVTVVHEVMNAPIEASQLD
jgi:ABC-type nitrate/sulfonate/bicarbonate transport system permease component